MAEQVLYQDGWSYHFKELGDLGFYLELTILREREESDDLVGVLLTRRYTIEESKRFSIADTGAYARVPIGYHTAMVASVSMEFFWVERNPVEDRYRFNVEFTLTVESPRGNYRLASETGEFNLGEPPPPALDGQMIQSFTTLAGIVNSDIVVVVDTMPSGPEEHLQQDFLDLVGPAETKDLKVSNLSVEDLVRMLLEDYRSEEPSIRAAAALLAQTQMVVAHSPLTVEPVSASLQHLALVGGTAILLTHPHLTPIAVLSWSGLDIFIRVQRKGGEQVGQQQAEVTDKLFEMMHSIRRNRRKSKRATGRTQAQSREERGNRKREANSD